MQNKNYEFIKLENNEFCDKLRYLFVLNVGSDWKQKYKIKCNINNEEPIKQDDLSDFEYFLKIHPFVEDENKLNYYLVVDGTPVTYVTLKKENNIFDLSFTTAGPFRNKGYASLCVDLSEEEVFDDWNVEGIRMIDQSLNKETSKIAIKKGYVTDELGNFFKRNPNYEISNKNKDGIYI